MLVPVEAVGAVGVPVNAGLANGANPAATNAVVASCVVLVPGAAVGAVGVPVMAGELANSKEPVPDSSVIAAASWADVPTNVLLARLNVLLVSVCEPVVVATVFPPTVADVAAKEVALNEVKVPAAGAAPPMTELSMVELVIARDCTELVAVKAVPAPLTVTNLFALPDNVGSKSKPSVMASSSARNAADEPGELGVG